ncbi:hypothetical protein [Deinococcus sp. 12RED42]|uniref:hypothetical protein n=1 Tax=Deinococcus sp. 12RED42 TaxID=2745872 RepID=UPI001E3E0FD4|nr:hypothetical protein [Deinococcus sp. 12RED42]MCD0167282.1 hypothetical protein [Deinococcus sp. 12RED42]
MGRIVPPPPRPGESQDRYLLRVVRLQLRQQQHASLSLLVIWAAVIAAVIATSI